MRAFCPFFVAMWLALALSPAFAIDPEVSANSIVRTYSDYCEPGYYETQLPADAEWDPRLAESYARALFTQYRGDCSWFTRRELFSALTMYQMLSSMPELDRQESSSLSDEEIANLASGLLLEHALAEGCQLELKGTIGGGLLAILPSLRAKLVHVDAFRLAKVYSQQRVGLLDLDGYPTRSFAEPLPCTYLTIFSAPERWLSSPQEDSEQPAGGTTEDAPMKEREYVWEPGDPGTNRGGDEQPINLAPYVAESDLRAIGPFTGEWGTTAACDEGDTYVIGQFGWQEGEPVFGRSVPRIETEHLSCQAGQWAVAGDISTFRALCHPDDEAAWSGTGTIRWVNDNAVQLFLLDDPQPVRLERCKTQRSAVGSTRGSPQAPLDLFGN